MTTKENILKVHNNLLNLFAADWMTENIEELVKFIVYECPVKEVHNNLLIYQILLLIEYNKSNLEFNNELIRVWKEYSQNLPVAFLSRIFGSKDWLLLDQNELSFNIDSRLIDTLSSFWRKYSKESTVNLMNLWQAVKAANIKLLPESNEEVFSCFIDIIPSIYKYITSWVDYLHTSTEENIEFVDRKSIQNINELIKELYLHLDHIILKIEGRQSKIHISERILRSFIICNPKLLSINMLIDYKMDRIISEFVVRNYHQINRK